MTFTSLHSQQISQNRHPKLGSPSRPTRPQVCGRLLTRLCTLQIRTGRSQVPRVPPLGMSSVDRWAQRCRVVGSFWTTMGTQGRHTYRPLDAMASSPGSWARGTSGHSRPAQVQWPHREEGVLLGPARAGLTLGDSAGPGGRTEVSPSHLPRSLEPSFRVGRGPGLCHPEPPTPRRHHSEGVAGQPCRGALVWMQACGDHVGDPLRMPPSEGPGRSPRVPLIPVSGVLGAPGWGMGTRSSQVARRWPVTDGGSNSAWEMAHRAGPRSPRSLLAAYHENSGLTIQL